MIRGPEILFASSASTTPDIETASDELASQLRSQLQDRPVDLALVFLSSHYREQASQLQRALHNTLEPRVLLGCTAEGVITRDQEIESQPAISLIGAHLPAVEVSAFKLDPPEWSTLLVSPKRFQDAIQIKQDPKIIILMADPHSTPAGDLLEAINRDYPQVPVIGGVASGSSRPGGNALFLNEALFKSGAVGVALSGHIEVDLIVSQGCRPIGQPMRVDASHRNVILALEGQPPLERLMQLVSELSTSDRALLHNGLYLGMAIDPGREELGRGDFLIRGVIGFDEGSGAIAVGDQVNAGSKVQFHLHDAGTAQEDLEMMLIPQMFRQAPEGALLFSCNGRGRRLFDHPDGDIRIIQQALKGTSLAGFFCAGEFGPVAGRNFLHGHTASLAIFRSTPSPMEEL